MKSILYVGATLMIGASIYGFVDYKKTSHKKEFIRMYEDQPATVATDDKEPAPLHAVAVEEVKVAPVEKQTAAKSKVEITAATKLEKESVAVNTTTIKQDKKTAQYKKAKRKKLDYRLFSRSRPPREIEEVVEMPEVKKLTRSTEQ